MNNFWKSSSNSPSVYSGLFLRVLTIISGAYCNFAIANLILNNQNQNGYALFAIITSIPNLIPFADFGLGSNIFNLFADSQRFSIPDEKKSNIASVVFFMLCLGSLLIFIFVLILTFVEHWTFLLNTKGTHSLSYICLLVTSFTLLSVPFSIGARKLQAEYRLNTLIITQGLIPVISLFLISLIVKFSNSRNIVELLIPSFSYLITTLYAFRSSQISRHLKLLSRRVIATELREIFTLGTWSFVFGSLVSYMWQIPRVLLYRKGSASSVVAYSLILLLLMPCLSLFGVFANWVAPRARQMSWNTSKIRFLIVNMFKALILNMGIGIFLICGYFIAPALQFKYPSIFDILIIIVLTSMTVIWQIPNSALTDKSDFKWLVIRFLPFYVSIFSVGLIIDLNSVTKIFKFFLFPISIYLIFLNGFRLSKLRS